MKLSSTVHEGGLAIADVDWLRRLARLPESGCEVEALARMRGAGSTTIVGAAATEAKVKELSAKGELKKYRVVAFAAQSGLSKRCRTATGKPSLSLLRCAMVVSPPPSCSKDR